MKTKSYLDHWLFTLSRWGALLLLVMLAAGCGNTTDERKRTRQPPPTLDVAIGQIETIGCSDTVRVSAYISVRDKNGNSFTGDALKDDNFSIKVNGSPMEIVSLGWHEHLSRPVAVTIVMDYSDSMGKIARQDMESAAVNFIDLLNEDDLVQVIKYATNVEVVRAFSHDKADVQSAITETPRKSLLNGTSLYDVLHRAIEDSAERTERRAVILISDGKERNSVHYNDPDKIVQFAQDKNVAIYTIGLANSEKRVLKRIARDTNGIYFHAPTSSDLNVIYGKIADFIQNQFEISFDYPGNPQALAATLMVRVTDSEGKYGLNAKKFIQCAKDAPLLYQKTALPATDGVISDFVVFAPFGVPHYAYLAKSGTDAGLQVVDITDPDYPMIIGEAELADGGATENCRDLFMDYPYLFAAGYMDGLVIFDISDPMRPRRVSGSTAFSKVTHVYVERSFAYLLYDTIAQSLGILDVADPGAPVAVGQSDATKGRDIKVHNGFVYTVHGADLLITDARDAAAPAAPAAISLSGTGAGTSLALSYPNVFAVENDYPTGALTTLDLLTQNGSSLSFENVDATAVSIRDGYAYVVSRGGGIVRIVDYHDLENPYFVDNEMALPNADRLQIADDHGFASSPDAFTIFKVN